MDAHFPDGPLDGLVLIHCSSTKFTDVMRPLSGVGLSPSAALPSNTDKWLHYQ